MKHPGARVVVVVDVVVVVAQEPEGLINPPLILCGVPIAHNT